MFNEGLSYPNSSEHRGYPYETVITIAKAFEENGQLMLKQCSGVHYLALHDEHIATFND
jgi:hypothetical protein